MIFTTAFSWVKIMSMCCKKIVLVVYIIFLCKKSFYFVMQINHFGSKKRSLYFIFRNWYFFLMQTDYFSMTHKGTPITYDLHINEDMNMHDNAKFWLNMLIKLTAIFGCWKFNDLVFDIAKIQCQGAFVLHFLLRIL